MVARRIVNVALFSIFFDQTPKTAYETRKTADCRRAKTTRHRCLCSIIRDNPCNPRFNPNGAPTERRPPKHKTFVPFDSFVRLFFFDDLVHPGMTPLEKRIGYKF